MVRDVHAITLGAGLSLRVGRGLFETPTPPAADDASVARDVAPSGTPVIRYLTAYVLCRITLDRDRVFQKPGVKAPMGAG